MKRKKIEFRTLISLFFFIILLVLVEIPSISCKDKGDLSKTNSLKRSPIALKGHGFSFKEICFNPEPIHLPNSKCLDSLPPGSMVELTHYNFEPQHSGADSDESFYKGIWKGKEGYIFNKEEKNESFYSIEEVKPYTAEVNVATLRLRKLPSLKAGIVTSLPQNTKVTIIGMGISVIQVGEESTKWAHVKLKDGKEGYAASVFLEAPSYSEADPGFAKLRVNMDISYLINDIDNFRITDDWLSKMDEVSKKQNECFDDCEYFIVTDYQERDDRKFFKLKKHFESEELYYESNQLTFEGWVDKSLIQFHGKLSNFYQFTKNMIKENLTGTEKHLYVPVADILNKEIDGFINYVDMEEIGIPIKDVNYDADITLYFHPKFYTRDKYLNKETSQGLKEKLLFKNKRKYTFLSEDIKYDTIKELYGKYKGENYETFLGLYLHDENTRTDTIILATDGSYKIDHQLMGKVNEDLELIDCKWKDEKSLINSMNENTKNKYYHTKGCDIEIENTEIIEEGKVVGWIDEIVIIFGYEGIKYKYDRKKNSYVKFKYLK